MPIRTFSFLQVDAFTDRPLGGNPCAIVLDADSLDDATMQAFALEMNLSETSFVCRSHRADFRVRYFTPAEEIPMAGHPTIATVFGLAVTGRLALAGPRTEIRLEMKAGLVPVEILSQDGLVEQITMTQMKPEFGRTYPPEQVLPAFGLEPQDALASCPIQTVSTGTPMLMVPLAGHDALKKATLDIPVYRRLLEAGDFFSPHLFCLGGATPKGDTYARHFGLPPDTFEDPFTGSATGCMAAYLWRQGLIESPAFTAEQGHWMGRPGAAQVEIVESGDGIEAVRVGGQAALVLQGEIMLDI